MRTIAKLSFKEILYKRIFHITIVMTIGYLLFFGIATHYFAQQMAKGVNFGINSGVNALGNVLWSTQFLSMGLFFSSFITALLSILASVGSVSSEIESHQIDTILARPIRRSDVILGKFMGLGSLMCIYAVCLFFGILFINQGLGGPVKVDLTWNQMLKAVVLFAFQPLIMIAFALWLSSRTSTMNSGVILIMLYGIGFIGGFVEQIGAIIHKEALINIGIISSLIFPADAIFRKMTIYLFDTSDNPLSLAAQGLFGSVSAPSTAMLVYAFLYVCLMLWLSIRTFRLRDL